MSPRYDDTLCHMTEVYGGLVVNDVKNVLMGPAGPELNANVWRLMPKRSQEQREASPLLCFWETDGLNKADYWVYRDNGDSWIFVQPNKENYDRGNIGTWTENPSKIGANYQCSFGDFAEAAMVILPPGMATAPTNPPARARLKRDRLVLFFQQSSGKGGNWNPTVYLYRVQDVSELRGVVGTLNERHQRDAEAREAEEQAPVRFVLPSQSQPVIPAPPVRPPVAPAQSDPSSDSKVILRVTLWIGVVTCVGVFVAAAALTHGALRIGGMIFGAVATAITAGLLIRTFRRGGHALNDLLPRYAHARRQGPVIGRSRPRPAHGHVGSHTQITQFGVATEGHRSQIADHNGGSVRPADYAA